MSLKHVCILYGCQIYWHSVIHNFLLVSFKVCIPYRDVFLSIQYWKFVVFPFFHQAYMKLIYLIVSFQFHGFFSSVCYFLLIFSLISIMLYMWVLCCAQSGFCFSLPNSVYFYLSRQFSLTPKQKLFLEGSLKMTSVLLFLSDVLSINTVHACFRHQVELEEFIYRIWVSIHRLSPFLDSCLITIAVDQNFPSVFQDR